MLTGTQYSQRPLGVSEKNLPSGNVLGLVSQNDFKPGLPCPLLRVSKTLAGTPLLSSSSLGRSQLLRDRKCVCLKRGESSLSCCTQSQHPRARPWGSGCWLPSTAYYYYYYY